MLLPRYPRLLLLGFLLIAILKAELAFAQPAPRDFNISPQALATALKAYADSTNLQLLYPSEIVQEVRSKGVVGRHTPQEALTILLQGTGLSFQFTDANTVTLTKAQNTSQQTPQPLKLEETRVTAERESVQGFVAKSAGAATKTDTPLLETPQSISVITRAQMEEQNVQSVPQALRYSPGVVAEQRGINSESLEYIYSRGFQIDEYLNGLRLPNANAGFNIRSVDPYLLERIEVLRGPASILYGQASPGGLLHLVSKRPTSEPIYHCLVSSPVSTQEAFPCRALLRLTALSDPATRASQTLLFS